MFGKIRSSSSPLESLQRPPSKLLKDDSLSIYESTLIKLKRGSNCKLSSPSDQFAGDKDDDSTSISTCTDPTKININDSVSSPETVISPNDEAMLIDTDCNLPRKEERSVSILYMFSKFKNAHQHAVSAPSPDSIKITDNASTIRSTEVRNHEHAISLPVNSL